MINRRLLRIKTLQVLYAHLSASDRSLDSSEKELQLSIRRAYDLYHYLFLLLIDGRDLALKKIEMAKNKRIPTKEDLNPNTRFVDNRILQQISDNDQLNKYLSTNKLSWTNHPELIRKFWTMLSESDLYKDYMAAPECKYEHDKKFILDVCKQIVMQFEMLYQTLEEQSIFWNDEVDYVIMMVMKTIKSFKEEQGNSAPMMESFRDEEDKSFAPLLLRKTLLNREDYLTLVDSQCQNWDLERIAFIDKIILIQAISEAVEFPFIPTRVTMNEYIDIAKLYSTEQSGVFVNGLLDKIFTLLKEQKRIVKKGKGLLGE